MTQKSDIEELEKIVEESSQIPVVPDAELGDVNDDGIEGYDLVVYDLPERKEGVSTPEIPQNIDDDYKFARDTLIHLIEQGNAAIAGALQLARLGPNPNFYDVASKLIKAVSENTDKLTQLNKNYKQLTGQQNKNSDDNSPTTVTNNTVVFNGTLEDLINMGKEKPKIINNEPEK